MTLRSVRLTRFRLVEDAAVDFAPGVNLLTGANAQGKTTVLEAIGYLATGRSFRTARDREVIAWSAKGHADPFAAVEGDLVSAGTGHHVRLAIQPAKKSVWVDGKPLRTLTELWGMLRTVAFVPADLQLVQGPPANRRTLLDALLGQTQPGYFRGLTAYKAALSSRNALFRRGVAPRDPQYNAFETSLAEHAAAIMTSRARLVKALSAAAQPPLAELSGERETLRLGYEPGYPHAAGLEPETLGERPIAELRETLAARWRDHREHDHDRGQTGEGPHRDDVRFEISGTDARTYASQGQTRSCVVALRLAELDLLAAGSREKPLLLLDDIMGELDKGRSERFLTLLSGRNVQTLITATDATQVERHLGVERAFAIEGGTVCAL